MAAWDMFVITTVGRTITGLIAALILGFLGFVMWTVSFPPLAGLDTQTFALVNTMAIVVTLATSAAWFKFQAEWSTRAVAFVLIAIGAFTGGWLGYDYGFDRGIEDLKALYFGNIPGGEIRVPTQDGVRWSLFIGALSANAMGLLFHVFRLLRYKDPGDF